MKKIWHKISFIGIRQDLLAFESRATLFLNQINFITLFFIGTSIAINVLLKTSNFIPALFIGFVAHLTVYFFNRINQFFVAKSIFILTLCSLLTYMNINGGEGSGLEFYFMSMLILPFALFNNRFSIPLFQIFILLFLVYQKFATSIPTGDSNIVYKVFYTVNSFYSGLFIILGIRFYRNVIKKHEKALMAVNRKIEEQNKELKQLYTELDAFTYSASHDLQSPLRTVSMYASLLERKYENEIDETAKSYIANLVSGCLRMKNLIDSLLALSQSSKKGLYLSTTKLTTFINSVINEDESLRFKGEIKLEIQFDSLTGDLVLFKQVFTNLISNAIKFSRSKEHPEITIGSYIEGKDAIYYVKDNGIGFEVQFKEKLFTPFKRLHSTTDFPGSGIGLSIVKSIVTRHEGKVWAESKLGIGSVFYFSLPV